MTRPSNAGPILRRAGRSATAAIALATFRPDGRRSALPDGPRAGGAWATPSTPKAGGTALDYGGVPRRPGVAIDTRGLDRLIDYPFADMTITVEAGHDPVGPAGDPGRAASARAGRRTRIPTGRPWAGSTRPTPAARAVTAAGRPRDQIIGVSFVTSEGVVVKGGGRVVKNVAGYDFPKLLTGSMGTLGIITQLTLKVRPIPEASAIVWVPFPSPKRLADALDSSTRPARGRSPWSCSTARPPGPSAKRWACRPITASWPSASKTMPRRSAGRSIG